MDKFLTPPEYAAHNYQGAHLYPVNTAAADYAHLIAFGMNYFEKLNQQLQLFPAYEQYQYVQLRHYMVDKIIAAFSAHPDNFIEGDLGESRESFMSLDQML